MKDFNIFFVSGLPRSGSTLLVNCLGQNPNHHVTPTSGLIELFMHTKNNWKNYIEHRAEGLEVAKPKVLGGLKGLIYGYYEKHFDENKVVFDKSRGWFHYIEDLEEVLGKEIKVLSTVRDVRDILASFEKIYQNRGIEYDYPLGDAFFKVQTIQGRCEYLLSEGGVVGLTINRLRDALARKISNRIVLVPSPSFTAKPIMTLNTIHKFLKLEPYKYDFEKIQQVTHENDLWHGMNLHIIKNEIKPIPTETWKGVLPDKYAEEIAVRYSDINKLCK